MSMYYFHVRDRRTLTDVDGTDLADESAARAHARSVVRELMFQREGMLDHGWSDWTMSVHDADDIELFSFAFSEVSRDE